MSDDLRRLTLEQMRAFASIAEHRSFTHAARSHMRTQTALTRQIKSMEDVLGARLFKRSRGHVEGLTETGQRLLPYARNILATVDDAWANLNSASVSGRIRVGVMDDIDVLWLNDLLSRFKAIHPDCDVRAISDFSVRLEHRLEAREIDVAIVKRLGTAEPGRKKGLLRSEPLLWAAGPGFRWDGGNPLPLVVFHEGCVYRRHLIQQLDMMGIASQVVYDGQSYINVRAAVFSGLGVSALAESQIRVGGLISLRELGGVALQDLGTVDIAVRHVEGRVSPALGAFIREVERHMQDNPGYAPPLISLPMKSSLATTGSESTKG